MPSESLESHLENAAWIALSASLIVISTSAMGNLTSRLEGQSLRAAALLVKECAELAWRTGCALEVPFPDALGAGKIRLEVKDRAVVAVGESSTFQVGLEAPVRDAEIVQGRTYKIARVGGIVVIEEVAP
ncbi:MAG: hypothetical protein JTT11_01350 [Candidatus Brockarchaeota archaeon]|nr:hypothetical protein [Candidatus Brockarchaeota archaeon]